MAAPRQNPVVAQKGRSAPSDEISRRVYESGLIQPGAHPEYETRKTPMDKLTDWFGKTFGVKHTPKPDPTAQPSQPGDK